MAATGDATEHAGMPLAQPAPVMGQRWWRQFPGEERQLGAMRRWLTSLLPDCPARDDVASIATELASNAIRHTASGQGGLFAVGITRQESFVRVAVADGGSQDEPRVINDPDDEHGRGLLLVRGLSVGIGACGNHCGRVVWADVQWPDPIAPDPVPAVPADATIR